MENFLLGTVRSCLGSYSIRGADQLTDWMCEVGLTFSVSQVAITQVGLCIRTARNIAYS